MAKEKQQDGEKKELKPAEAAAAVPGAAPAEGAPAAGGPEGAKVLKKVKVKHSRVVPYGIAFVDSSFNNTRVTITDKHGGVIAWCSGGRAGFKGARKSTAYAASVVAGEAARQALSFGVQELEVRVQGPGAGRESAIRALATTGMNISSIRDVTAIPHNGCRARKRRRV